MTSSQCAAAVVAQLCAQGVTDAVLAPGSRSAPLALALARAEADGLLRLHVRFDERSAGFLALGLAKASGRVVPVVTTSGTAVGNLLPAVLEAHHSGVPLLVISADRPAALVGFGANQTTSQAGLFQGFVRWSARVSSAAPAASWTAQAARACLLAAGAVSRNPGPAHLNVELDQPLVGDEGPLPDARPVTQTPAGSAEPVTLAAGPRTLVICGDAPFDVGRSAADAARAGGVPLIAEPSSNARSASLRTGRLLLGSALVAEVERVVVFGRPTLSRPVNRLLARDDIDLIVVSATPEWVDPGWRAAQIVPAVRLEPGDPAWLRRWRDADATVSAHVDDLVGRREGRGDAPSISQGREPLRPHVSVGEPEARTGPAVGGAGVRPDSSASPAQDSLAGGQEALTGPAVAAAVVAAVGGGVLMLGNSQPIRDADLTELGEARVYANRGLAGIDGTISTAAGVALASGEPVTLLCGDLTFLHDGNGLAAGLGELRPDLRIVVADDGGGSIFATLEYGDDRYAGAFERVFGTPSGVDPVALAAAHGLPATRVHTAEELAAALAGPIAGVEVLVATVDRSGRRALNDALNALATLVG